MKEPKPPLPPKGACKSTSNSRRWIYPVKVIDGHGRRVLVRVRLGYGSLFAGFASVRIRGSWPLLEGALQKEPYHVSSQLIRVRSQSSEV